MEQRDDENPDDAQDDNALSIGFAQRHRLSP